MSDTNLDELYPLSWQPVERREEVLREEFESTYLSESFRPVVVTREVERWPAL